MDVQSPVRVAYSLDETASALSLSRRTLYNLIGTGELRTVKLRGRRLVPVDELRRIMRPQENAA